MKDASRKAAIAVGVLYIMGTVSGVAGAVCLGSAPGAAVTLALAASNGVFIQLGSFFILLMGFSLAFIPVVLYPVLKRQGESLAIGYAIFRGALETSLYCVVALTWLLMVDLGRQAATVKPAEVLQGIAAALVAAQGVVSGVLLPVVFFLGAIILYYAFYRSRLIPRWISVFGLFAIVLSLSAAILGLLAILPAASALNLVMSLPLLVQEMVMAVWLIAKGFNEKPA